MSPRPVNSSRVESAEKTTIIIAELNDRPHLARRSGEHADDEVDVAETYWLFARAAERWGRRNAIADFEQAAKSFFDAVDTNDNQALQLFEKAQKRQGMSREKNPYPNPQNPARRLRGNKRKEQARNEQ